MKEQSKTAAASGPSAADLKPDLRSADLKPAERILLWRLAAAGGGEWIGDIRPTPSAAVRKEVLGSGLARSEARKNQETGRQGTWVELTAEGWEWTGRNIGEEIGGGSAAGDALSAVLKTLGQFLSAQRFTVEDVFQRHGQASNILPFPADSWPPEDPEVLSPMVEAAIVRAYLRVTAGRYGIRILLTQLRPCVELSTGELDSVLRALASEGRLELSAIGDDALTAQDREAALRGARGESFHAVCLDA